MRYTQREEDEMNSQLIRWKKRQLAAVGKQNIDVAFDKMFDTDRQIWMIITNAESYKNVNWLVWQQA